MHTGEHVLITRYDVLVSPVGSEADRVLDLGDHAYFVPDVPGEYLLRWLVSDGKATVASLVVVTAIDSLVTRR